MNKTKKTPLWVFLAFSAIETRRGALILIFSCAVFTLYCLPWTVFMSEILGETGRKIFLIDDWSWAAMMTPITLWYAASLIWMDKNNGWLKLPAGAEGQVKY